MMRSMSAVIASAMLVSTAFSPQVFAKNEEGPCKKIKDACSSAGFVVGQAKEGTGLWVDCIDPIMRGTAQPKKAAKPLPQVDPQLVAACKAKRPNFGQAKDKK